MNTDHTRKVRSYYHTFESIVGYRFMTKGVKHFGYHDNPGDPSTLLAAQERQDELVGEMLQLKPGAQVLECGCGEGSAACYIAPHFELTVRGIDLLSRNIARANRTAQKAQLHASFQVGDYMHLPFEDNSFDGAYAMETLVHAPDPVELFKEIRRVLKPGGVLVFCEYSMTPRTQLNEQGQEIMTKMNTYGYMPSLERFTTGAFPALLQEAGFDDVEVKDVTPHFMPTLKYFYDRARRPNRIIKALHLEKHFINAYSAAEIYAQHLAGQELVQYNFVRAVVKK